MVGTADRRFRNILQTSERKEIFDLRILLGEEGLFLDEGRFSLKVTITVGELSELCHAGANVEIIDVRSETEYAAAHIPGAKCIPLQQLSARRADLSGRDLVLVCQAGTRARMAQTSLNEHRGNVLVLEGGTSAWREAGLPLVAPLGTSWSLERQVRLGAGLLILLGITLTLLVDEAWIWPVAFVGAGLTFAGATDICLMGRLLARMPWNQFKDRGAQTACSR